MRRRWAASLGPRHQAIPQAIGRPGDGLYSSRSRSSPMRQRESDGVGAGKARDERPGRRSRSLDKPWMLFGGVAEVGALEAVEPVVQSYVRDNSECWRYPLH